MWPLVVVGELLQRPEVGFDLVPTQSTAVTVSVAVDSVDPDSEVWITVAGEVNQGISRGCRRSLKQQSPDTSRCWRDGDAAE